MQVAACRRRAICAFSRRGGGGRGTRRGTGGGAVCRVARLARNCLRSAWHWFLVVAWLRRTWSWTWWRVWCGIPSGTVCKLPHARGVQLVLFVGVTAADVAAEDELDVVAGVVRLVVYDGVHVAACVGPLH